MQSTSLTLLDVLDGVSPDYAVIAQKAAAADVFHRIDPAFAHEYGLNLATLAARYDAQLTSKAQQAEAKAQQAEAKAQQAESYNVELLKSYSWRMTAPVRWVMASAHRALAFFRVIPTRIKALNHTFLAHFILYARLRPRLNKVVLTILNRLPALKQRIKRVDYAIYNNTPSTPVEFLSLTQSARLIYADFKTAIEKNKVER
jgi:O-antigen chain-terminating methyltransferase